MRRCAGVHGGAPRRVAVRDMSDTMGVRRETIRRGWLRRDGLETGRLEKNRREMMNVYAEKRRAYILHIDR